MKKYLTEPTILDDVPTLSITYLKRMGFWDLNGPVDGPISCGGIRVELLADVGWEVPYITLTYNYRGQWLRYDIPLVSVPSNLGKGEVWYFECPLTGRRCYKLYFIDGQWGHRTAFENCLYERQTRSKYVRECFKTTVNPKYAEQLRALFLQKYSRRSYADKPTKRFLKLARIFNMQVFA